MVMLAAERAGGLQTDVADVVHGMQKRQGSRNAQIRTFGDGSDRRGACWEEGRVSGGGKRPW